MYSSQDLYNNKGGIFGNVCFVDLSKAIPIPVHDFYLFYFENLSIF